MAKKKHKHKHDDEPRDESPGAPKAGAAATDEDPRDASIAALEEKLAEAEENVLRARADFQNYQRRAIASEREAREWGAAGVLGDMVAVLDHFDVALSQDPDKASAASIIDGVRLIKGEMVRALKDHGVASIEPAPGDELDPGRHEALGQMPAEGVEPGRIAKVMQTGYAMGDRVLRPAKVFVTPAAEE